MLCTDQFINGLEVFWDNFIKYFKVDQYLCVLKLQDDLTIFCELYYLELKYFIIYVYKCNVFNLTNSLIHVYHSLYL